MSRDDNLAVVHAHHIGWWLHIGLDRPHESSWGALQGLERPALPTAGLEGACQPFAITAIWPWAAMENHPGAWCKEDCVWFDTGKHLLKVSCVHP